MDTLVPSLMRETRNYYPIAFTDGCWTLKDGLLSPADEFKPGDWIAITGAQQSGVYRLSENCAIPRAADESWTGRIWLLAPPADFLALAEHIAAWCEEHRDPALTHESFGAYSRSIGTSSGGACWQEAFSASIAPFRRMYTEVKL